jgi:hypothetical protein
LYDFLFIILGDTLRINTGESLAAYMKFTSALSFLCEGGILPLGQESQPQ